MAWKRTSFAPACRVHSIAQRGDGAMGIAIFVSPNFTDGTSTAVGAAKSRREVSARHGVTVGDKRHVGSVGCRRARQAQGNQQNRKSGHFARQAGPQSSNHLAPSATVNGAAETASLGHKGSLPRRASRSWRGTSPNEALQLQSIRYPAIPALDLCGGYCAKHRIASPTLLSFSTCPAVNSQLPPGQHHRAP